MRLASGDDPLVCVCVFELKDDSALCSLSLPVCLCLYLQMYCTKRAKNFLKIKKIKTQYTTQLVAGERV